MSSSLSDLIGLTKDLVPGHLLRMMLFLIVCTYFNWVRLAIWILVYYNWIYGPFCTIMSLVSANQKVDSKTRRTVRDFVDAD